MSTATPIPLQAPAVGGAMAVNPPSGAGSAANALFAQLFASAVNRGAAPHLPPSVATGESLPGGKGLPLSGKGLPLVAAVNAAPDSPPPFVDVHALMQQVLASQPDMMADSDAAFAALEPALTPAAHRTQPGNQSPLPGLLASGAQPQPSTHTPVTPAHARASSKAETSIPMQALATAGANAPNTGDAVSEKPASIAALVAAAATRIALANTGTNTNSTQSHLATTPSLPAGAVDDTALPVLGHANSSGADARASAVLGKLFTITGQQPAAVVPGTEQVAAAAERATARTGMPPGLATALAAHAGIEIAAQRPEVQPAMDLKAASPLNQPLPTLLPDTASTERWSRALGERVTWMINGGNHKATIQLHPAELGQLELRVNVANQRASVEVTATQAMTRDLIETMAPRLATSLEAGGIKLEDLKVQLDDGTRMAGRDASTGERRADSGAERHDAHPGSEQGGADDRAAVDDDVVAIDGDVPTLVTSLVDAGIDTYA